MTLKRVADNSFPDLSKHNNHMAKALTEEIYNLLKKRITPSGFSIDNVIQTGVDNPGMVTFSSQMTQCKFKKTKSDLSITVTLLTLLARTPLYHDRGLRCWR